MSNKLQQRDGVGSSSLEDYEKELVEAEKRAGVTDVRDERKGRDGSVRYERPRQLTKRSDRAKRLARKRGLFHRRDRPGISLSSLRCRRRRAQYSRDFYRQQYRPRGFLLAGLAPRMRMRVPHKHCKRASRAQVCSPARAADGPILNIL